MKTLTALITLAVVGTTSPLEAEPSAIYRTEKDGVISYSSKPHADAAPADLPKLGRWKPTTATPNHTTCDQHGGIDCDAGADTDGSIVCRDGFRDAILRFKFLCTAAKLELMKISDRDERGAFTVILRNMKSIRAIGVGVTFSPTRNLEPIKLQGPSEIEPFSVGEYRYDPGIGAPTFPKPTFTNIEFDCENCGGAL